MTRRRQRRRLELWQYDLPRAAASWPRFQHLIAAMMDYVKSQRLSGELSDELDESYYGATRQGLLAAGALDADIDRWAVIMLHVVMDRVDAEHRDENFELIVNHLAQTDIRMRIRGDQLVEITFPTRPAVH